ASGCGRRSRTAPAGRSRSPSTVTSRKPPTAPSARPTVRSSRSIHAAARCSRWSRTPPMIPTCSRAASGAPSGARWSRTRSTPSTTAPCRACSPPARPSRSRSQRARWGKGGHGPGNLHKAIVESCDVFFYQVGRRLGVDGIAEYAHRLGLGLPTGIALPHEQIGTIPDTEWKRRRFGQPWFEGETLSVAIGQGYVTATPLQMANLAATIANGGTRRRPFYVKRVVSQDGSVLEVEPEVLGQAHLKKSTLGQVREGMREVVMSESGTGKK